MRRILAFLVVVLITFGSVSIVTAFLPRARAAGAVPPEPDTCKAEGGCIWTSRKDLADAFLAAAQLGYAHGAADGAHDAELVCRNNT